jgi:hypothetical protein
VIPTHFAKRIESNHPPFRRAGPRGDYLYTSSNMLSKDYAREYISVHVPFSALIFTHMLYLLNKD